MAKSDAPAPWRMREAGGFPDELTRQCEQVASLARHGLAISAGVTLYVAASNLVPHFQGRRGWLTAAAFFGGAFSFFAVERLLEGWAF